MPTDEWTLKSNYMLALTVCKHAPHHDRWPSIAKDLADVITTTPESCQSQFDSLCQRYGQDWQPQSAEPLHVHVFSTVKHSYYEDLCERMTESNDLLLVVFDFVRLFRTGRMTSHDIGGLLRDVEHGTMASKDTRNNERQLKIKIFGRLKSYMTKYTPELHTSRPLELLPPPLFLQPSSIPSYLPPPSSHLIMSTEDNDRQVPSLNGHASFGGTDLPAFPSMAQWNNPAVRNEKSSSHVHPSNEIDIDEIELISDDDDDDDDNDRTAIAQVSTLDETTMTTNSNLNREQDESTSMSDEQMETNQSSDMPPAPVEISNSNDRDVYDNVSSSGVSNQSTVDTGMSSDERPTSSATGPPMPNNHQVNASISGSSDYVTLDSDQVESNQQHYSLQADSNSVMSRLLTVQYDEAARMDAEQIPEPLPADITDVAVPNDNAVFVLDESVSHKSIPYIPRTTDVEDQSMASNGISNGMDASLDSHQDHQQSSERRGARHLSHQAATSLTSQNFRKSITSILSNLKNAKYSPDFAKPLKSFKLHEQYYARVKQPLDIPEIRERMNNGHYDDNILLFERDVLLMFTNALCMYHREDDIHGHARYMLNHAMELLSPVDDVHTPWKVSNDDDAQDSNDVSNLSRPDNGHDEDDDTLHPLSSTRTPSVVSTSSSIRTDSSTKPSRRQTTSNHPMQKRQRRTMH